MFEVVDNIHELNQKVANSHLSFVYFGHPECSVCHGLKPQIDQKLKEFGNDVNFYEVNTFVVPEVAGDYSIMTVPVVLLFVEGKEYLRQARFVPIQPLYEQMKKIVTGFTESQLD